MDEWQPKQNVVKYVYDWMVMNEWQPKQNVVKYVYMTGWT